MAGIALPHLSLTRDTESAHGKVKPHRVCFSLFHSIWLATAVINVIFGHSPPGPQRAHQLRFWPTRMCVGVHWDSGSTKKPGICGLQMRTWASWEWERKVVKPRWFWARSMACQWSSPTTSISTTKGICTSPTALRGGSTCERWWICCN